jgi:hypothetical protein
LFTGKNGNPSPCLLAGGIIERLSAIDRLSIHQGLHTGDVQAVGGNGERCRVKPGMTSSA